jgi:tetratricopeptide (TPR) repeat protein
MTRKSEKRTPRTPAELPQKPSSWHVTIRKMNTWVVEEDAMAVRPYLTIVTIPDEKVVLAQDLFVEPPTGEQVRTLIFQAMKKPERTSRHKPHRPERITFEQAEFAEALASGLAEIGVEAVFQPAPAEMEELFHIMDDLFPEEESDSPGILTGEGVTPELVGDLFAAAAAYYRSAPWQLLADVQPLATYFSQPGKQGYVQLMGNAGIQFGLLLYWDWEHVLNTFRNSNDPLQQIPPTGWHTLTFENADYIPSADLDAIEKYGWQVESPHAYPIPITYIEEALERPSRQEIIIFTALLRAIPSFVALLQPEAEGDYLPAEATLEVETCDGPMTVTVGYPAGEFPEDVFDSLYEEDFEDSDLDEEEAAEPMPFERRLMEAELSEFDEVIGSQSALDPAIKKAQRLVYEAWEQRQPAERARLARQALQVSPDCADAYVILAEDEAETVEKAYEFYSQGTRAGERALGSQYFEENAGHFWGLLETRPYMRARLGMAECLAAMERHEEALAHYHDLLRLNPVDNQGVRHELVSLLVHLERDEEAQKVLDQFHNDFFACSVYTQALLAFRKYGDSPQAGDTLRLALARNPHVPAYLTGSKLPPAELPDYEDIGEESEAIHYVVDNFPNWWNTKGAIAWLNKQASQALEPAPKRATRSKRKKK